MTRGNPGDIQPFDPEIDRTFHRLVRHSRNLPLNNYEHSPSLQSFAVAAIAAVAAVAVLLLNSAVAVAVSVFKIAVLLSPVCFCCKILLHQVILCFGKSF